MSIFKEDRETLKRSINSILSQDFSNFEFIIILDNPENIEAEILIKDYTKKYNNIIFIKNKVNKGKGKARNKWIYAAKWKYIALMDADDFSYKNRFLKQYNFLEKNKNVDLVFPSYRKIFSNWKIKKYECKKYNLKNDFLSGEWHLNWWMMIKAYILKENPYKLFRAPEEFELFIRLIKKGYKFYTLSNILYDYMISDNKKDINDRFISRKYENKKFLSLLFLNYKLLHSYSYYYTSLFRTFLYYLLTRSRYIFWLVIYFIDKNN